MFKDEQSTIRVGPYNYKVKQEDKIISEGTELFGIHSPSDNTIRVKNSLPPSRKAEVLMHETLHAMIQSAGLCEVLEGKEETVVENLGTTLVQFVRDNPEFLKQIKKMSDS